VIELYAIVDEPVRIRAGAPLRAVAAGRLAAVCGPTIDGEPTPADLWRREELIEALMAGCDLLPARYGTRFADERTAAQAVGDRHDDLLAALDRVRGAVELSVRVLAADTAPAPPPGESGTAYMEAKARHERARRDAASAVHEPLGRLARASVVLADRPGADLLRAAYLVERGAVERFVERVAALQSDAPELRLLCTGPWPAYSFTGP
jgi:hypothetical protein